ncbi:hypothetical protein [Sphingomonas xinjiangensis]|uniref:Uncharacterized protein n=1 Tax=Sphingomonas xinjiangensis TaxID=643568 RepID=A0A840YIT6_9SPHN|nr:hypothetical protein [Sphingomonas xinjiangensis]MBB5712375.1 hypothetical protein [Sphingomonas xinjiangensis]
MMFYISGMSSLFSFLPSTGPDWSLAAGKWVMLVEDEPFRRPHNRVIDLQPSQIEDGKLIVDLSPGTRLVLSRLENERHLIHGSIYWASEVPLPEGDPALLWKELEDVEVDDPRFDDLPGCDPVLLIRDDVADAMFVANDP